MPSRKRSTNKAAQRGLPLVGGGPPTGRRKAAPPTMPRCHHPGCFAYAPYGHNVGISGKEEAHYCRAHDPNMGLGSRFLMDVP